MRINIQEGYMPLEDFKTTLDGASNLKDVYLLCHQAGCPVYVLRDIKDNCAIHWHPMIDDSRNTVNIVFTNGVLELYFEGVLQNFDKLDELRKCLITDCMLGKTPFDEEYLVWRCKTKESKLDDIDWEEFKNKKSILLAETEEIAQLIVNRCFEEGVFWDADSESDNYTCWSVYGDKTVYLCSDYIPMCDGDDNSGTCIYFDESKGYGAIKVIL